LEKSLPPTSHFTRIGMIARWQPVHCGHQPVLRGLCARAEHALIGIGSSNEYNYRSPFTLEETTDMIRLLLGEQGNYTLIPVPDLHNGPRWRAMVLDLFGELDCFVTANPYVESLLSGDYRIVHPIALVAESDKVAVDGSLVRREMARGDGWQSLVPEAIAAYIRAGHLDERFRREFGLQTLAIETVVGGESDVFLGQ
jgi:nicotinamide-nucleotide adenylyltransferase